MRLHPSRLALTAAAVLALSTAAVAAAQDAPPPPGPPPGLPPMIDEGPGGPPPMMRHHRLDPEAHAQHLRDVLQLRADQEGALKAYLAAAGPRAWDQELPKRETVDAPRKPPTTTERLDREAEFLDRAKARLDATRAFYAALSPSQKKAFDALGPMVDGSGPMMRRVQFHRFEGAPGGAPARPKAD